MKRLKEQPKKEKKTQPYFRDGLRFSKKSADLDPSTPEGQSLLGQHFISHPAPDSRRKLQTLQFGPQTPMPQPLEETSGLFTDPDQTEEEERTWRANRLARAQAKLRAMLLAVRPQDDPRGPRKFNCPPGGKAGRGERFKYTSTGHRAKSAQKHPLVRAQSVYGHWRWDYPQSQRGRGLPLPRQLCWTTKAAWGFWRLLSTSCLSPSRSRGWSLTWQVRRLTF